MFTTNISGGIGRMTEFCLSDKICAMSLEDYDNSGIAVRDVKELS